MLVLSYSRARSDLKRLCDTVRKSRVPARIHRRRGGDVVVVAVEDWEAMTETEYVRSIPGAVRRIERAGDFKPLKTIDRKTLERLIRT